MSNTHGWTPTYRRWRHGGWYVTNLHHQNGASGCVSNNYPDKKWRIVCDDRRQNLGEPGDFTFASRDAAARAERALVESRLPAGAKFDQADFNANPEKYRLFRTARLAETVGKSPELAAGAHVRIEFFSVALNAVRGNTVMPVYKVSPVKSASENGAEPDLLLLYACALMEFVL